MTQTQHRLPRHPFPHLAPNVRPHALSAIAGAAQRLGIDRRIDHTVFTGRTDPARRGRFEIEGLRVGGGRPLPAQGGGGGLPPGIHPPPPPGHHRRLPLPPGIHPRHGTVW